MSFNDWIGIADLSRIRFSKKDNYATTQLLKNRIVFRLSEHRLMVNTSMSEFQLSRVWLSSVRNSIIQIGVFS